MILEVAVLHVCSGESGVFERAFAQAQDIISAMPGYISHLFCSVASNHKANIFCWCSGRSWRITPLVFASRPNIKTGMDSCTVSTIRPQRWNTMSWCLPPNKSLQPTTLRNAPERHRQALPNP